MFAPRFGIPIYPSRRTARNSHIFATCFAIVVLLILLALIPGCNATPARQAYIGVEAATDVVNGVGIAYDAKRLSKAQVAAILPYADAVKVAQDDLDNAILAGKVDIAAYQKALNDAVTALLNQTAKVKRQAPATAPATTQPH